MIQYIIAAGIGAFLGSRSKKSKKSYAKGGKITIDKEKYEYLKEVNKNCNEALNSIAKKQGSYAKGGEVKIIYLDSENSEDLEFDSISERDAMTRNHKQKQVYSLDEFITAFNDERISDLGYLMIDGGEEAEILYINPDDSDDLEYDSSNERDELIRNHPNTKRYALMEFSRDFNAELISDLGYVLLANDKTYAKGGEVDLDAISKNPPYAVAIDMYGEGDPDDIFVGFYKDNRRYGGGRSYYGRGASKNVRWSMRDVFNDGYEPKIFQTIEDYRAWKKSGSKMAKGGKVGDRLTHEELKTYLHKIGYSYLDEEAVSEISMEEGFEFDYSDNKYVKKHTYAKGGKTVKRYIVYKGDDYDGEVVGSSDTFRGARMIRTRLEKKGVFKDVDTYGISDTENYTYIRKDNKFAKGGKTRKKRKK